jgi:concanavalin A-like lectin/glucanase superfamily protein
MSHHARRPIRRGSFTVSLLFALLLAGFAGLTLTRQTEAVYIMPSSKAEKALPSAPNMQARLPTPIVVTKCPTSRWLAEGNANDSNGFNQGILKNGATFGPGAVGRAFRLNGVLAYVEAPISTPAMNTPGSSGSFTWEACVNPTSLANNPVVFSKELGPGNRAGLQINANGSICSYMNSGSCAATSAPGVIATGHFARVTLLYDGSTNSFVTYVNGLQVSTATVPMPYNNSAPFNIGWSQFGSGNTHFPGLIDEVSFSSCAVRPTLRCCGATPTSSRSPTPIP